MPTCPCLLWSAQYLDLTNGKIKIEDWTTLSVEHQVQKEYTGKEMAFCHSHLFFDCPLEISPFPFKPYSQLTPVSLLVLCPEVITMAIWVLAGVGPSDVTKGPTLLGPHSPGARADQHTRGHFLSAHRVVLKWFLCLSMGVICVVYFSEKENRRTPGEGALWRTLSNLAESTRICPRLAWDHVALAFPHCADVCDSEVGRTEWRE